MRIRIVGTGNAAVALGRIAKSRGHEIVDITGRTEADLRRYAAEFGCGYHGIEDRGIPPVDFTIVAVSDAALKDVVSKLHFGDGIAVHTAGSMEKDVFAGFVSRYGILYPLQSINKEQQHIPPIPFLTEGSDAETSEAIRAFAATLSDTVTEMGGDKRLRLHTAAVIVNNFTNYLYTAADDFCEKEDVDFNLLVPLIEETAVRMRRSAPRAVQTGPAKRGDIMTIDKHLRLLNAHPHLKTLYLRMSDSIMNN